MQVEDLMQLSRPEALAMKRKIDDMLEDAADVAVVNHIKYCDCSRMTTTLDYFIDAPLLNE